MNPADENQEKEQSQLNQAEQQQYSLLQQSVDEEKTLLQSTNIAMKESNVFSKASSVCDQPIIVSSSNLGEGLLYQEIPPNQNETEKKKKKDEAEKEKKQKEEQEKTEWSFEFDGQKSLINSRFFKDLFKWKREFNSNGQWFFQMAFDSLAIWYAKSQVVQCAKQREQNFKDEKLVRDCVTQLSENPFLFYNKANVNQRVVLKGYMQDQLAVNHINNKMNDSRYSHQLSQTFPIKSTFGDIQTKFDSHFTFEDTSSLQNRENKMNFLTKLSTSVVSLFSGYLFRSSVTLSEGFKTGNSYYFFGQKISLDYRANGFTVSKIFKSFDLERFKVEQAAYLLSMLIASGVGLYFAIKLVKNLFPVLTSFKINKVEQQQEQKKNEKDEHEFQQLNSSSSSLLSLASIKGNQSDGL